MSTEDILFDKITSPNGTKRMVKRRLNDHIEVEFEVTTKDGEDDYQIKNVTVTSSGPPAIKVVVDDKTIIDPNPVYYDDGCYLKETRSDAKDLIDEVKYFSSDKRVKDVIADQKKALDEIRNTWTPLNFGSVTANDNYTLLSLSATPTIIAPLAIRHGDCKIRTVTFDRETLIKAVKK